MKKKLLNKKGFTLIELIVVIAIIAILAAIIIPRFAGFTDKANKQAVEATAKTILTSYSTLIAENPSLNISAMDGTLPADAADMTELTKLTGNFKGTLTGVSNTSGNIDFTYTEGDWSVVCTDSTLADAT